MTEEEFERLLNDPSIVWYEHECPDCGSITKSPLNLEGYECMLDFCWNCEKNKLMEEDDDGEF